MTAARPAAVRGAKPADAPAIARVHARAFRARGHAPAAFRAQLEEPGRERIWLPRLPTVVVAGDVGFAWFGPAIGLADAGELYLVCVEPDRWRTGIGSALMAATAERLRAMGWSTAVPWTGEANTAARRAYEANGWTPDGATQTAMRTGTSS